MEIWKDIKGYEGLYQVSNFGNVRSLDRKVFNKGNKLITRIEEITQQLHNHITLHSKPPSIVITAESEEGKRFIENFKKWKGE